MTYRDELVQVAAVALAMIEDLVYGVAGPQDISSPDGDVLTASVRRDRVFDLVEAERIRQDAKWGGQHHAPATWLLILAEEVGETADEVGLPDGEDFRSTPCLRNGEPVRVRETLSAIVRAGQDAEWLLKHCVTPDAEKAAADRESERSESN